MADILNTALAYSCALPAVAGMVLYKRMDSSFHPFIWAMWLSLITETSGRYFLEFDKHPVLNLFKSHLYYILNYLFILLFFYRQKIISASQFKYLLMAGAVIFVLNGLYKPPTNNLLGEKTIAFHLILFYFAVQLLSQQVFSFNTLLSRNALFFIACGLLLYAFPILQNTTKIVVRYYYNMSSAKITVMQRIFEIANALSYILFFSGVLFIPKKKSLIY